MLAAATVTPESYYSTILILYYSMKVLPADTTGINAALKILRDGGVVAHATETCYGLACDLRNPDAVQKLFRIKQRPLDQPVSALFSSLDQAKEYVEWNDEAESLAKKYLPGPLTLILQRKPVARYELRVELALSGVEGGNPETRKSKPATSLGMRISSSPLASTLVEKFGSPLSTTSANLHGQPNPYSPDDIIAQFSRQKFQPDLILDSGTLPHNPPSTVIDLSGSGHTIRRQGTIK